MKIPASTAAGLRDRLLQPLEELSGAWNLRHPLAPDGETTAELLCDAFEKLYAAMQRTEADNAGSDHRRASKRVSSEAVTELGEYALQLFEQAAHHAKELDLPDVYSALLVSTLALARWIGVQGGQLLALELVVDALAQTANSTQDPGELLTLYQVMNSVIAATAPAIARDLEKSSPGRPWRLLLLNRAIVATRSHQPDVMEEAFASLTGQLPEDAPGFFTQGMEQMDLLNYPSQVREVMDRYYRKWSVNRSLH